MKMLAQRLVACKHFRWMPGMHAHAGRVLDVRGAEICLADEGATEDGNTVRWVDSAGLGPYLTDDATLGCLLALVRHAHGEATIHVVAQDSEWDDMVVWHVVSAQQDRALGTGDTEAEALVAALEAA